MKQLDLDDLPPRAAALLAGLTGEDVLVLVQNGLVVGRLTGAPAGPAPNSGDGAGASPGEPAAPAGEARAAEIFEQFRSLMEDEF